MATRVASCHHHPFILPFRTTLHARLFLYFLEMHLLFWWIKDELWRFLNDALRHVKTLPYDKDVCKTSAHHRQWQYVEEKSQRTIRRHFSGPRHVVRNTGVRVKLYSLQCYRPWCIGLRCDDERWMALTGAVNRSLKRATVTSFNVKWGLVRCRCSALYLPVKMVVKTMTRRFSWKPSKS